MSPRPYQFCPYCATPLVQRTIYGQVRPVCPTCNFVQYFDPKVAVIGLVTHDTRVLLIQRAVEPAKGKWALPGGYMDAGEVPSEALQRELLEEVDLAVQVESLIEIFPMVVNAGPSNGIVLAFHAVPALGANLMLRCQDDACDARGFSVDELPEDLAFESTPALLARWQQGLSSGLAWKD
jgi:8-oxo-dGTP diphosphatase